MLRELGKRAPLLHIKDGPATMDGDMTAVGEGVIDLSAIAEASKDTAEWWIVELDRCATDMLQAVDKSLRLPRRKWIHLWQIIQPILILVGVGIIGCGNISEIYCKNLKGFANLNLVACADIDMPRAKARAAQSGILAQSVDELLDNPEIEIVVNLTIPAAHADVSRAILKAGKHVYSEKPLATRRREARAVIKRARKKGLRVGGAPDTFLGGSWQTVRKLIDAGAIGAPVAATGFMLGHGPERWHPNPDFFYQPGAGPLFDMGPYYLTAFINLFGAVEQVASLAQASFPGARRRVTGTVFK